MPTEAIKITANTDELDAKLSKSMRELGVHYDEYGRLINKEGQFVAGLSQASIKMGDYVDAQGRMRNANGQLLEGLTNTEKKLRMFVDEQGNVIDAEGNFVRSLNAETQALNKQDQALTDAFNNLMGASKKIGKMANNLSMIISLVGNGNEGMDKFARGIVIASQSFSQFSLAMGMLPKITAFIKAMTIATEGQTIAQVALNAVTGNWIALAAGALAAGTAAVAISKSMPKETDKTKTSIDDATKSIDKMSIAWERVRETVKNVGSLTQTVNAGFSAFSVSESDLIDKLTEDYLDKDYKAADAKAGLVSGRTTEQDVADAEKARAEAAQNLANAYNQLASQDLPTDEMAELKDRAKVYTDAINSGKLTGDALANAQKALENNLKRQAEIEAEKNKAEEERLKQEEEEARRQAEETRRKAESALGDFAKYASGDVFKDQEVLKLNETIERWKANFEAAGKSQEELDAAISSLKKEYNDRKEKERIADNERFVQETGINDLLKEEKTALEIYNDQIEAIAEATERGAISTEQANKAREEADKRLNEAKDKEAEQIENARQSRLSELGILGLRDQGKSDWDRVLEKQKNIESALNEGLIEEAEAAKLNAQVLDDYYSKLKPAVDDLGEAVPEPEPEEKTEVKRASSITAGSQELYSLLTQRDTEQKYQNEMRRDFNELNTYSRESRDSLQTMDANIKTIMDRVGVV